MIPLTDLKDHLRLPQDHVAEDAYLAGLEQAAVAAVEAWTGRYFGPLEEVADQVYSGTGGDVIWIAEADPQVVAVEAWDGAAWQDVADFEVDGFALYHTADAWERGRRNVRVTYTRGYAPGEEPADVRVAVMMLVAHWYVNHEPVVTGTIQGELPFSVRALVAPYRLIRV